MGAAAGRTAFVETIEHGAGLGDDFYEYSCGAEALQRLGFRVVRFTVNEIRDGGAKRLGVTAETPVVGGRESLRLALQSCGSLLRDEPLPERDDYPVCLRGMLGRRVERCTLQEALDITALDHPLFVKPRGASRVKLFTGLVLDGDNDAFLDHIPRSTPVWISEALEGLVAEFRCYTLRGKVLSVACYRGNGSAPLDLPLVRAAAARLHTSNEGSVAFALDVGVQTTASGSRTVLIEVNDGFSLGLYPGCEAEAYAAMMVARWDEMAERGNQHLAWSLMCRD